MASLNRSYILSRIMAQLAASEKLLCLPSVSLEAAADAPPDLSIYRSGAFDPDLFKDVEVVAEAPLVAIDIMDGRRTMNESLERARTLEMAGVRSCWVVEPVSHSVLVLEQQGRHLFHEEQVERQGVAVDFAAIFGGESKRRQEEARGEHRLVTALRRGGGDRKIFLPSIGPDDWKHLLAEPDKHWQRGMPTRAMAHCWEENNGIPPEISRVLGDTPGIGEANALFVVPEYQVPLPGGARPARNDIWLLAETRAGLASITVDAKARESFGQTVGEWNATRSEGKDKRLRHICEQLEISFPPPDDIKYSLLQRAASAVIEARRFKAPLALTLVHSFSSSDQGIEHFNRLLSVMGLKARPDELAMRDLSGGGKLGFAWVRGDRRFLDA